MCTPVCVCVYIIFFRKQARRHQNTEDNVEINLKEERVNHPDRIKLPPLLFGVVGEGRRRKRDFLMVNGGGFPVLFYIYC